MVMRSKASAVFVVNPASACQHLAEITSFATDYSLITLSILVLLEVRLNRLSSPSKSVAGRRTREGNESLVTCIGSLLLDEPTGFYKSDRKSVV